jgi:DNA-binding response OmpR family regulator
MYDIVLIDVLLPEMSGIELLKKIKENPKIKDTRVFMISQMGEEEYMKEAKELGAEECLVKANFSLKELTALIEKRINHSP